MPKQDPIAARRLRVAQVRDLAIGVGLAIRTALILWAHLLDDVVPDA